MALVLSNKSQFNLYVNPSVLRVNIFSLSLQAAEYNQYAVDFSHQEMMERAKMQLDMEVKGEVKVKSIAADDLRETLRPKTVSFLLFLRTSISAPFINGICLVTLFSLGFVEPLRVLRKMLRAVSFSEEHVNY